MAYKATLFFLASAILHQSAPAATLRVSKSGSGTDGLSWETAFTMVNAAMTASASGDEIWVASGTYVESVQMADGVELYGGFSGVQGANEFTLRDSKAYSTVLSGTLSNIAVVYAGDGCLIDGFTVTQGGRGGIVCASVTVNIRNCVVQGNRNLNFDDIPGGGICCRNSTSTVQDCAIGYNRAYEGGGVYADADSVLLLIESEITANRAESAFLFLNPAAIDGNGGGVACKNSDCYIRRCLIDRNSAAYGGGVLVTNATEATIEESRLLANVASAYHTWTGPFGGGGAIYAGNKEISVSNCLVAKNHSHYGGAFRFYDAKAEVVHCTIAENTAGKGGAVYVTGIARILNSILYGNDIPQIIHEGFVDVRYSDVQWGWPGEGNFVADPLFEDPELGDYRLSLQSPCIDAGSDEGTAIDLEGYPRPVDIPGVGREGTGAVDMGAYEIGQPDEPRSTWTPTPTLTPTLTLTPRPPSPTPTVSPTRAEFVHVIRNPSSATSSRFAYSLALSDDKLFVGCPNDSSGADQAGSIFVYDRETLNYQFQIPHPFPERREWFGTRIATLPGRIIVGPRLRSNSGTVTGVGYAFDSSTGDLLFTYNVPQGLNVQTPNPPIASVGSDFVVGAPHHGLEVEFAGAVYLYDGLSGELKQTIENPFPNWRDYFGEVLHADGHRLFISAPGRENSITNTGSVYVFNADTKDLLYSVENPTTESRRFGIALATANDVLFVGHPYAERIHGFNIETGSSVAGISRRIGSIARDFGFSISGLQNQLLIGAPTLSGFGFAFLFDRETGSEIYEIVSPLMNGIDNFGISVLLDGNRLLVGAPTDRDGGEERGSLYVFTKESGVYPTPTPTHTFTVTNTPTVTPTLTSTFTPTLTLTPIPPLLGIQAPHPHSFQQFGATLASVPDFTGDGFEDLAVGAYQEGEGSPLLSRGRVHLYDGKNGAYVRTLVSPNDETRSAFGFSLSSIVDLNGNGAGEVLVGASLEPNDLGLERVGRVHVIDGASGDHLGSLRSPREQEDGYFGYAVSSVPDTNNDGFADILVGAVGEDAVNRMMDVSKAGVLSATDKSGRAYLFDGRNGSLLLELDSPYAQVGGWFGSSVAGISDASGQGRVRLLVSAEREAISDSSRRTHANVGIVYVFDSSTGEYLRDYYSESWVADRLFGRSVLGIPDLNRDGVGEAAIASFGSYRDSIANRLQILNGASDKLLRKLEPPYSWNRQSLGASIDTIPDWNGNGVFEILAGTPLDQERMGGRVYLFDGETGNRLPSLESPRNEQLGAFGWSSAVLRSETDSSFRIAVGANLEDSPSGVRDTGRVYLFDIVNPPTPGPSPTATTTPTRTPTLNPTFATDLSDLDGNGKVDAHDLLQLLKEWETEKQHRR